MGRIAHRRAQLRCRLKHLLALGGREGTEGALPCCLGPYHIEGATGVDRIVADYNRVGDVNLRDSRICNPSTIAQAAGIGSRAKWGQSARAAGTDDPHREALPRRMATTELVESPSVSFKRQGRERLGHLRLRGGQVQTDLGIGVQCPAQPDHLLLQPGLVHDFTATRRGRDGASWSRPARRHRRR